MIIIRERRQLSEKEENYQNYESVREGGSGGGKKKEERTRGSASVRHHGQVVSAPGPAPPPPPLPITPPLHLYLVRRPSVEVLAACCGAAESGCGERLRARAFFPHMQQFSWGSGSRGGGAGSGGAGLGTGIVRRLVALFGAVRLCGLCGVLVEEVHLGLLPPLPGFRYGI